MKLFPLLAALMAMLTCPPAVLAHDLGECPVLAAKSLTGEFLDIRKLNAKLVIVEYWATWCPPCIANLRHLQTLKDKYEGVEIVGINSEDDAQAILAFMAKWQLNILTLWDRDTSLLKAADPSSLPYTVVLDASGCVIWKGNGTSQETVQSLNIVVNRHAGGQ